MYHKFYEGMNYADLPLFALLLFLSTFAAVVLRVTVMKKRQDFDRVSRLPLDE
ncbi:MAG: CcoQ/FixQ family Cbb3-type cytochrome c oxidase assembly chaperone [Deltaproteobacteria bacterium]|nr:CcoQ/FixQ family Cbb3-type cytochrome c oxidase assembly chaperone [Deltaproteobacteria bacterium]